MGTGYHLQFSHSPSAYQPFNWRQGPKSGKEMSRAGLSQGRKETAWTNSNPNQTTTSWSWQQYSVVGVFGGQQWQLTLICIDLIRRKFLIMARPDTSLQYSISNWVCNLAKRSRPDILKLLWVRMRLTLLLSFSALTTAQQWPWSDTCFQDTEFLDARMVWAVLTGPSNQQQSIFAKLSPLSTTVQLLKNLFGAKSSSWKKCKFLLQFIPKKSIPTCRECFMKTKIFPIDWAKVKISISTCRNSDRTHRKAKQPIAAKMSKQL